MFNKDGKAIYGVCKVSDKGQIVIPKEAREDFDIKPGECLVLLGDKNQGMALVKTKLFEAFSDEIFKKKGE